MAVSPHDRKILWAQAHDACAMCRTSLVLRAAAGDPEAVLGQEAHIVARRPGGPRGQEEVPDEIDGHANLILLCPTCHRVVDTQPQVWPPERLQALKARHAAWGEARIRAPEQVRVVAHPDDPHDPHEASRLLLLSTGVDVWNVVCESHAYWFAGIEDEDGHPEEVVNLVDGFLQLARDWGEISSDVQDRPGGVRDAKRSLGAELRALNEHGLLVFGRRRRRLLTGGSGPPTEWGEAQLVVARSDDPRVFPVIGQGGAR